ncbi:MAG TPA: glutamate--tRNA ligase [Solirubrobacteraceae bacterium]|nr:glutamate--tRNA ligase [Solirubrobacteraceae bacterium]
MRVRFAPSPTGALHIGGARTALFNWLLARHDGGVLVLRIEDTDRERSTPENVAQIIDALRWLELDWDEGPVMQSERAERHREALAALLDAGHAYRSRATADDVRRYKEEHGSERGFRGADEGEGAVRLRVGDEGETVVHDAVRGPNVFRHEHLDDPVIARADDSVLYNFAVAVDDLDADITHVVRGEDHVSNTPKQLLVLQALRAVGFHDAPDPLYAHLPLLHGPDGKKLSKRHGAASVQELRDAGYLPEAVRNYLALLGWGAGDDETVLSTGELVRRFTLERISRNPARFDEVKLGWLNGVYIRAMDPADLTARAEAFTGREGLAGIVRISQEKIHTLADLMPLAGALLDGAQVDEAARERWLTGEGLDAVAKARAALAQTEPFDEEHVERALVALVAERGGKPRDLYQPLRVALTGSTVSPGIFESIALLGRDETLRRLDESLSARR